MGYKRKRVKMTQGLGLQILLSNLNEEAESSGKQGWSQLIMADMDCPMAKGQLPKMSFSAHGPTPEKAPWTFILSIPSPPILLHTQSNNL